MGYRLYREIRDRAPAQWTAGERLVALMIADHADDNTRKAIRLPVAGYRRERDGRWVDGLTDRTGLSAAGVSKALQRLAARGFEFRIPISVGKDGRPVFAAKGHALDFAVPAIPQRADNGPGLERADHNPAFEQRADRSPANSAKGRTVVLQRADGGPPPFPQVPSEELFPQVHHARAREAQPPSATERGNRLLQEHIDAHKRRPPRGLIRQTASAIEALIADEAAYTDDEIRVGLAKWRDKPNLGYGMLAALVNEAINPPVPAVDGPRPGGHRSTTNDWVAQAREAGRRVQAMLDARQEAS
jgi:hypothetical protein